MINSFSTNSTQQLVDNLEEEKKQIRKRINVIAFHSEGAYKVHDMWNMPLSQIQEIEDLIIEIRKSEKDAMDNAKGKTRKVF